MAKAKREKKSVTQQKAADVILADRDLVKNPLTAAEIVALPRKQRPPRSEWPNSGADKNPRPYSKRRRTEAGALLRYSGGGSGAGFFKVLGFLILWAACSFALYGAESGLSIAFPYLVVGAIIGGLWGAVVILDVIKGGSGRDLTRWF